MNNLILFKASVLATMVVVCLFGVAITASAAGTVTLSQASNVTVTFVSSSASHNNTFGISSPISRSLGTGHGTASGTQFSLGQLPAGEAVFYIVHSSGTWYSGSPSRNSDNFDHAIVTSIGSNQWQIAFEDLCYGGDRDYNDIIIRVTATPACTANASKACSGNAVYWYDSCGVKGSLFQQCTSTQTCQNAQCVNNCTPNATKACVGNAVYWFDSCNAQGSLFQACTSNQICQNGQCVNVTCSSSSNCGTNGYTGSPFCQSGNVYQNYITYTCNNPGTANSYCSNSTAAQLKDTCASGQTCFNGSCTNQNITCTTNANCGTNGYIGSPFCQSGNVYQNYITYTCNNPGTANSYCSNSTAAQLKDTCASGQTCFNGSCTNQNITCTTNANCGSNGYIGSPFCQSGNVYQNYITYTCNNPGTANSHCSNDIASQLKTTCTGNQTCNNGSCSNQNITCSSNTDCGTSAYTGSPYCQGNNVYQNYITWTCNNSGTSNSYCSNSNSPQLKNTCSGNQTCQNGSCSGQNCTWHSYQQCSGNYLYWYDSCGNQQDSQYCQNGCSGNSCTNNYNYNYNYYGNCTYHAYKLCIGNNIYWYDSCGAQQDFYQSCTGSLTCQYGLCVNKPYVLSSVTSYVSHYRTGCYGNAVYWFDSYGSRNSLYQSCVDSNSCTQDTCAGSRCSNVLKCDGSTCATGSADYNAFCQTGQNNNNTNNNQTNANVLSVSFFAKQDATSVQWQKIAQLNPNGKIYFMISAANNSGSQIDNVNVSANVPGEVSSLGNLQVNGVPVSGDIVTGIVVGSLPPATSKSITFEGIAQNFTTQGTKQAVAAVNGQTDAVSINLNPGQSATASVSSSQTNIAFWEFLKRWYLWILVALVIIFLFVVVFRRLSSNS